MNLRKFLLASLLIFGTFTMVAVVRHFDTGSAALQDPAAFYVLAVSWQPAFCETHPGKPECIGQTDDRFDATNFSLHGLWPQPGARVYCGEAKNHEQADKAGNWAELPEPELSERTSKELAETMPGRQSHLDRHEWIKHGSCYPGNAEEYFATSLSLLRELNASGVRKLFSDAVGGSLTSESIREAFDDAFGPGAGKRVKVSCKDDHGRRLIVELTIGLAGDVSPGQPIGNLMLAADPTTGGCPDGIVDVAGLQ